uniref:Uncharacterized protein n=1 Tax=Oryza sativa subsp. japonica TaxID=39947 RepID=Q652Y6_ORYSJ|nr:hypothetical protein [Oryza sativa Japonica Group]BAD54202.1 hypothetical protein [Oryza sativa Japonica Group]
MDDECGCGKERAVLSYCATVVEAHHRPQEARLMANIVADGVRKAGNRAENAMSLNGSTSPGAIRHPLRRCLPLLMVVIDQFQPLILSEIIEN